MSLADRPLVRAAATGVACSVAFIGGMFVDDNLRGSEERMVVNALQRSNELGGLIDSLGYSQFQSTVYDDLGKIRSLDEISALREKYRQSAVGSIHVYEQRLAAMSPEKRRALEALHSGVVEMLKKKYGIDP